MPNPPTKYKRESDFSPDEVYRSMRGERILSPEFIRYRNDLLNAGGLGDEATPEADAKPDLETMSPADHLIDLQKP